MRLRAKLLLAIVPVVAGAVLSLGGVVYVQLRAGAEEALQHEMDALLTQTERRMRSRLDAIRADTRLFANTSLVRRYMRERHAMIRPAVLSLFASYREAHPEYREIRLLSPDGFEDTRVAVTGLADVDDEEGEQTWFRDALGTEGTSFDLVRSADDGATVALFSRRVTLPAPGSDPTREGKRVGGLFVIGVEIGELFREVIPDDTASDVHLELTDGRGRVLHSSDPGHVGTDLARVLHAPPATRARLERRELYGRPSLVVGRRFEEGLHLLAIASDGELRASARRLALAVALISVAASAASAALVLLALSRLVLAPLQRLGRLAHEIGEGRFDTRPDVTGDDELGDLARALAAMSERLRRTLGELRGSHDRIEALAYHDSLTGLPNRRHFLEHLDRAIARSDERGTRLALLFLDLEDFKRINDTLGHERGDELLIECGRRLAKAADDGTERHVARLGGDEFTVVVSGFGDDASLDRLAADLIERIAAPLSLGGHDLTIGSSVGLAVYPDNADSIGTLMRHANAAMHAARRRGGRTGYRFDDAMQAELERDTRLENDLRLALLDRTDPQLHLHYQPQLDIARGIFVGVEALLRWEHPELGRVGPDVFVPVAERTGMIRELGARVLDEACAQWVAWREIGIDPLRMSVNVSARQFVLGDVRADVVSALAASSMPPSSLEIELTESCMMEAPAHVAATLATLRELGVRVAMDDFGTGHSSLGALLTLPLDTLKIDRCFVSGLRPDTPEATIVRTILTLARTLGLEVVAEGVETTEELAFLRAHGCELAQGYLLATPLPAPAAGELLIASGATGTRVDRFGRSRAAR